MRRFSAVGLSVLVLWGAARLAWADTTGRLSLTMGSLWETSSPAPDPSMMGKPNPALTITSPDALLWFDLRSVLDSVAKSGMTFHSDFRLRLTPDAPLDARSRMEGQSLLTARGYNGGREYELRELYTAIPLSDRMQLTLGRQILLDADAITIDGARIGRRLASGSLVEGFAGLFPNPFSRSVRDDYIDWGTLAFAFGTDFAYEKPRLHGALALVGETFFGQDGGNQVGGPGTMGPNEVTRFGTETPRLFAFWRNYWRPREAVDLFQYLVLDLTGEAGTQVTQGHAAINWRPTSWLRIETSYSRMSTLAAEIYLVQLLYREPHPATFTPILNNLVLMRMAQDEARMLLNVTFGADRYVLYWSGRYLHRGLLENLDPRFASQSTEGAELTMGVRDLHSIAGLRLGAEMTALYQYRSQVYVGSASAGREFAHGAGTVELDFAYERWRDDGFGRTCDPMMYGTCFGTTTGTAYDLGGSLGYRFSFRWLLLGDYHLVVTDERSSEPGDPGQLLFTHLGFARIQYRF